MGAYELTFNTVAVVGFVIVDTDTEGDVRPLIDGDQLVLEELPANLSIRATVSFNPGSVRFGLDGEPAFQVENLPPYALAGDSPQGNYQAAPSAFTVGEHTITATPFLTAGATGAAGIARTIRYTVVGEL
jgi:hypothetical protein